MHIYIINDNMGNFEGAYIELHHAYMRMLKRWLSLYGIDDRDYYDNGRHEDKVDKDWILYKIPVGEFEEVFIQNKNRKSAYVVELPETYGKLRCEIRDGRINEIVD